MGWGYTWRASWISIVDIAVLSLLLRTAGPIGDRKAGYTGLENVIHGASDSDKHRVLCDTVRREL